MRFKLYDHWDALPPGFWIRFGNVLAADSDMLARSQSLAIGAQHPWVEALALDLVSVPVSHATFVRYTRPHRNASMARLEALLESAGAARSALVESAFQSGMRRSYWIPSAEFVASIPGFEQSAVRDADRVHAAFRDQSFENRLCALRLICDFSAAGQREFRSWAALRDLARASARARAPRSPPCGRSPNRPRPIRGLLS